MRRRFGRSALCLIACVATALSSLPVHSVLAEVNWPRWGGPTGDSHTDETGLPQSWTDADVLWKTSLPGFGQSMPCVWGDKIFLTSALDGGKQRVVLAIDRRTGRTLWEQTAWTGEPEPSHVMNGHASATCATNGDVVVAFFGRGGLHAYTVDGKPLWSRDLGQFDGPWGTAASPILHGDLVIQNCDSESAEASLLAVNARTGETVWSTPRKNMRGWSTPIIIQTGKREELVLNGHHHIQAYDPKDGHELWACETFNGRGEPVPAFAHDRLFVMNGLAGDIYCVQPGGDGDVTATHRLWHTPRKAGRDLPSPVVVGNYLLACSMPGILFCYDCASGKELWKERIGPKYAATPLVSDGRAYFLSEDGQTAVIEPGDTLKVVAQSKLTSESDELFRAAIVPCQGQLLIRSSKYLYCIGQK
ncbi:MAG: PQQ-binding-like beta-propeller repeat protein [Pirellulales bacterium]